MLSDKQEVKISNGVKDLRKSKDDEIFEKTLRPHTWDEYLGQEKLKKNLRVIIEAAKKRREPLEHLLFYGNPGLGKTTLAHVIANEMGVQIKTCAGPALEKPGDIASLLTNLEDGDILFVDECHRINKSVMEMLYSAMEDFQLHLVMGKGPMARTMELNLPKFTLVGATTRAALLSPPLRNRFGAIFQLSFYEQKELEQIIKRSASILGAPVEGKAVELMASRSRFTPRIANRIFKRVRDFATIEELHTITEELTRKALALLEIDELGLEPGDRKILKVIIKNFSGGPAGVQALAAAASEEQDAILDMYEPYLLQIGFIERTPRGRIATDLAYKHLGFIRAQKELL